MQKYLIFLGEGHDYFSETNSIQLSVNDTLAGLEVKVQVLNYPTHGPDHWKRFQTTAQLKTFFC